MLILFSDLRGFGIQARDGRTGSVDDIFFDDKSYEIRHVVTDIGPLFFGRKALLGSEVLREIEVDRYAWRVDLNKGEVESAPGPETGEPVSAQEQRKLRRKTGETSPDGDRYPRSMSEVRGYKVRARDDWIGLVKDFVIDTASWRLRQLVVVMDNWLPPKTRVVLPVDSITDVDWSRGEVTVEFTSDQAKAAPTIDSIASIVRTA